MKTNQSPAGGCDRDKLGGLASTVTEKVKSLQGGGICRQMFLSRENTMNLGWKS